MNKIEWARIPETNYKVSNDGRVRSVKGETIRQFDDGGRLLMVRLTVKGIYRLFHVHELVAEAFVDNPHHYAKVIHVDGDTLNNTADNLQWKIQSVSTRKVKNKPKIVQYDMLGNKLAEYVSIYEASMATGINKGSIYKTIEGKNKTANGYFFKREEI